MGSLTTAETKMQKKSGAEWNLWLLPCCGFIFELVVGLSRSDGILYVNLIEAEQFTRGEAAWPISVRGATALVAGPVVGILSARWTPYQLTLCGSILFVFGYAACYFSTALYVLIPFYGAACGIPVYIYLIVMSSLINIVFKENRGLAMGISECGSSVGGFIWPHVTLYLLETYALKGTFLVLAGIAMHSLIASFGLLAFNIHSKDQRVQKAKLSDERTLILSKEVPSTYSACDSPNKQAQDNVSSEEDHTKKHLTSSDAGPDMPAVKLNVDNEDRSESKHDKDWKTEQEKPAYFNSRIIKNVLSCRGLYLIVYSGVVIAYFLSVYTQVHVDYLQDKGIPIASSVNMMVTFSVGDLAGRLGLSWVTDKNYLSRQFYASSCVFLTGGLALLLTFIDNLPFLLSCSFFIGVFQGSITTISAVMIADYTKKDEIPVALGFVLTITAAALFTTAPVIGYFRDVLKNYDLLFRTLGGVQVFGSLLWLLEGIALARKQKNSEKNENAKTETKEEGCQS